jgi:hypothetical protein
VVLTAGAAEMPPSAVHVAGFAQAQSRTFCPHPFARSTPHLPAYVALHEFVAQHVFVVLLQMPLAQLPHVTVDPQVSSKVPHSNCVKSAHVFGVQGGPHTPFALHTSPSPQSPHLIFLPVHALVTSPQFLPSALHSSGVDFGSHRFAIPRTPQLSPALHPNPATASQFTVPPQPFDITPHSRPFFVFASLHSSAALFGTQLGSQVWKTALHLRAPPSAAGAQPPQSV